MTDRPIIFSAPMVRALLDGRKTQTRRVLKPQPSEEHALRFSSLHDGKAIFRNDAQGLRQDVPCLFAPGDRLWVREQWSGDHEVRSIRPSERPEFLQGPLWYWADGNPADGDWERPRPSIHMPRWASRLTLTLSDVRVQRLHEISEEDAWAEGCKPDTLCDDHGNPFPAEEPHPAGGTIGWDCARDWFADLWESLHGTGAWDANPWVVALTFAVHRQNIDQMEAA